jgi:D-inositol-3-phosphate glycosyltransferase
MVRKNIVIVSHYYPPHSGGIEVVAQNEAQRLVALGHSVTVVTSKVSVNEAWNGLEKK